MDAPSIPLPVSGDPEIAEIVASDGYRLHVRRWRPKEETRGILVALHGIQSHAGWYDYSSRRLRDAGWDVWFLDRRGSGANADARGHVRHPDRLVNDVVQTLKGIRLGIPGLAPPADESIPIVLLGLSWGGRLAACVAARHRDLIDGLVLLYPGIHAHFRPTWTERRLLWLATVFDALEPTAPIPLDDPALFTSQPQWQEFIRTDPVTLRRATAGFYAASAALEHESQQAAGIIRTPALVMLAGRDRIIDNEAMRGWFANLASREKTLVEFAAAEHTLEFEPCRDRFIQALLAWLGTGPDHR